MCIYVHTSLFEGVCVSYVPSSWLWRGVSRFGTGILVPMSLATPAAPAKVNIGQDLEAGSTRNVTGALQFEKEHDFRQSLSNMP